MHRQDLTTAFDRALAGRRLLDHPYYRAWQDGSLRAADLAEYAAQYRHVEQCLPAALATTVSTLPDGPARHYVEAGLRDERTRPEPHVDLFERFADAVGADSEGPATDATADLVALYGAAAGDGAVAALAVIGAYELQAAGIASTKAASLRDHYGLGPAATLFWDVHAGLEDDHAAWTVAALDDLGADPAAVGRYAEASATAWWAFLDEREAAREPQGAIAAASGPRLPR